MSPSADDRQVDALYGLPPQDFIAARKRLAGELKKSGDAAGARAVAALVKPTLAAWVTNQTVRRAPELIQELVVATDALATAQTAATRTSDQQRRFQEAQLEQRRLITRLMEVAAEVVAELGENVGGGALEKVEKNLRWGTVSAEDRAAFVSGRLTRDIAAPGFGALVASAGASDGQAGVKPGPTVPRSGKAPPAPSPGAFPHSTRDKPPPARGPSVAPDTTGAARRQEKERERAAAEERRAELASLREELRQARADSADTARVLRLREGERTTAQKRVQAAEHQVQIARAALDHAEQAHHGAVEARAHAQKVEAEVRERLESLE